MRYDTRRLSNELGFRREEMERVLRIVEVLDNISDVQFLEKRLSLYSGTALNFLHLDDIPRLSVNLDFNFRQTDDKDWGEVRDEVDEKIKEVLRLMGYEDAKININPSYPLVRFDVSYESQLGKEDSFIIEIGYMRRFPILGKDKVMDPHLPSEETKFGVRTPQKEELFANKISTCIYRTTSRDVYDVYRNSTEEYNKRLLRECLVLESLMEARDPLYKVEVQDKLRDVSIGSGLKNLLRKNEEVDSQKIIRKTRGFIDNTLSELTSNEKDLIQEFYEENRFDPSYLEDRGTFHKDISEHPAIRWALENKVRSESS